MPADRYEKLLAAEESERELLKMFNAEFVSKHEGCKEKPRALPYCPMFEEFWQYNADYVEGFGVTKEFAQRAGIHRWGLKVMLRWNNGSPRPSEISAKLRLSHERAYRPGREVEFVEFFQPPTQNLSPTEPTGWDAQDLVAFLSEIHALKVDLYLHQQGLDTTTPGGKAMFQMMGVFAEFERAIIQERVRAGLARVRAEGKTLGRPRIDASIVANIRKALQRGDAGMHKIAVRFGVATGTVQRVRAEMAA
jgi:hypothetical protein